MKLRLVTVSSCLLIVCGIAVMACKKEERKDLNAPIVNVQKQIVPETSTSDINIELEFSQTDAPIEEMVISEEAMAGADSLTNEMAPEETPTIQ